METSDTVRILIVEHDPVFRLTLTRSIESYGCVVDSTGSATHGLELIRGNRYGMIFVASHLPDGRGSSIARHMKARPRSTRIPVVSITSDSSPRNLDLLKKAGANKVVIKPITREQIGRLLAKFGRPAAARRNAESDLAMEATMQKLRSGDTIAEQSLREKLRTGVRRLLLRKIRLLFIKRGFESDVDQAVTAVLDSTVERVRSGEAADSTALARVVRSEVIKRAAWTDLTPRLNPDDAGVSLRALRDGPFSGSEREAARLFYAEGQEAAEVCIATGLTPAQLRGLRRRIRAYLLERPKTE